MKGITMVLLNSAAVDERYSTSEQLTRLRLRLGKN